MRPAVISLILILCAAPACIGKEPPVELADYVSTAKAICICTVEKDNGDGTVTAKVLGALKGDLDKSIIIRGQTGHCVISGPVSRFMKPDTSYLVFLFDNNRVGRLGGILEIDDKNWLIVQYINGFRGTAYNKQRSAETLPLSQALMQIRMLSDKESARLFEEMPRSWPASDTRPEVVAPFTAEVLHARAQHKAEVLSCSKSHISTAMGLGCGEEIRGGGIVEHARCRQTFDVLEVLIGDSKPGKRVIEYGYVSSSDAFPGPHSEDPIPVATDVILFLDQKPLLLKVLPDTEENRQTVEGLRDKVESNILRLERVKALNASLDSVTIRFRYHGPQDKPFYNLKLCVPPVGPSQDNPFSLIINIDKKLAKKIIRRLSMERFLRSAEFYDVANPQYVGPTYALRVSYGKGFYEEPFGWGPSMLKRLDNLRQVLNGEAAQAMDILLERLSGYRKQWKQTKQHIRKLAGRSDLIARGTVSKLYDGTHRDAGMSYDVKVNRILKGTYTENTLHFNSAGRIGYAKYTQGEKVLLFLQQWPTQPIKLTQLKPVLYLGGPDRFPAHDDRQFWEVDCCLSALADEARYMKRIKANPRGFALQLRYFGPEHKDNGGKVHGIRLALSGPCPKQADTRCAIISNQCAEKIVDYLAREGFFTNAEKKWQTCKKVSAAPAFVWTLCHGGLLLEETDPGWGPQNLVQLRNLRDLLDPDAAEAMDDFIAAVSRP